MKYDCLNGINTLAEHTVAKAFAVGIKKRDLTEFYNMLAPDANYTSCNLPEIISDRKSIESYFNRVINEHKDQKSPFRTYVARIGADINSRPCVCSYSYFSSVIILITFFEVEDGFIKVFRTHRPEEFTVYGIISPKIKNSISELISRKKMILENEWTWCSPTTNGRLGYSTAFGAGVYVNVNIAGFIAVSKDCREWREVKNVTNRSLTAVAYINGYFWAVGEDFIILKSIDGENWQCCHVRVSTDDCYQNADYLEGICHGSGRYIAYTSSGAILSSKDGSEWTEEVRCINKPDVYLFGLQFCKNRFILIGGIDTEISFSVEEMDGLIVSSPNGISGWKCFKTGTKFIGRIESAGESLKAYSLDDRVLISKDGIVWNIRQDKTGFVESTSLIEVLRPPVLPNLYSVAFGGGVYVAVGDNGGICTSVDGKDWNWQEDIISKNIQLHKIVYLNGLFVAVGSERAIVVSKDGVSFSLCTEIRDVVPEDISFKDIHFSNGVWALAASNGMVLFTADFKVFQSSDTGIKDDIEGIRSFKGKWFAYAPNGLLLVSSDGIIWDSSSVILHFTTSNYSFHSICTDGKSLVLCGSGEVLSSNDGINWELLVHLSNVSHCSCQNGNYIAFYYGVMHCSKDGREWLSQKIPFNYIKDILVTESHIIAVGELGTILEIAHHTLADTKIVIRKLVL